MTRQHLNIEAMQAMVDRSSFNRWLGMRVVSIDEHELCMKIRWRDELVSSPERQSTHGGVIAALIDCSADYVIAATIGHALPTLDLHIDYHRVALPGDLLAKASITHLGAKLGVAKAHITDGKGQLIASGRGMYMVTPPPVASPPPNAS